MKILFITSLFPNRDNTVLGKFNLHRALALKKLGCKIKVIAPIGLTPPLQLFSSGSKVSNILGFIKKGVSIPKYEEISDIDVSHPKWFWPPKSRFWKYESEIMHQFIRHNVASTISSFNPDLIILSWLNPYGTYSKYLKKFSIPIILLTEGSDVLIHPIQYKGIEKIEKIIEENVDATIFVSENSFNNSNQYLSLSRSTILYNGYDKEIFKYAGETKKDSEKINLISVGRHSRIKGYDILLNAMKHLNKNITLTMCGAGELSEEYKKFIADNNLNERVKLTGELNPNEIKKELEKSDIYCQPSRSEGFPSAPLEAMACGLPVVATKVGGMPELIHEGFNGYLSEPESVSSMVETLEKAAQKEWDRKLIAEWTKVNYGWDRWANKLLQIYKKLLSSDNPEVSFGIADDKLAIQKGIMFISK